MTARAPEVALFHLPAPVDDLAAAREFYGGTLRCPPGRGSGTRIDWDPGGRQLVTTWCRAVRGGSGATRSTAVRFRYRASA